MIPPLLASSQSIPAYRDVTEEAGLNFVHDHGGSGRKYLPETMGSGGCVLDFDGDGWMDVYLVQSGSLTGDRAAGSVNRLFRNRGDGTFEDVTERAGVGHPGYGQGAVAADYDRDGDTDLYITNLGPNVLYRNNGDGSFDDVTAVTGTGDARWGSSAAFFDADRDGWLDLYVVNYLSFTVETHVDCGDLKAGVFSYCHPDVYPMAADVFYRNLGNGTFADQTESAGLSDTTGKGLGIVVTDMDNDGDSDLYIANDSTPNFLYLNDGKGVFSEWGLFLGVAYNDDGKTEAGMGVDAGDVNGDGFADLFVTNLSLEANALYLGGSGGFRYGTRSAGLYGPSLAVLGFGTDLFDADNDGDPDLLVVNGDVIDNIEYFNDGLSWRQPGQLFLNRGAGRFEGLAPERLGGLAEPRVGRGSMTLDYDNDGMLDLLICYNNDRARLFRGLPTAFHWLGLHLLDGAGVVAVGARVTLRGEDRVWMDELKTGSGYLSGNEPRLHFGLGAASTAQRIEIRWPSGRVQVIEGLEGDRYYLLREGESPRVERFPTP